jgi:uncharacterized membrane protein
MRGLAVVVMIECHTFNSFARTDLREGGAYVLSQFIGGMAAPLFLLMAGMTTAFQMESLERRGIRPARRWAISLKRAGYILAIAFTFRFTNWFFTFPHGGTSELTRVDILNCMGVGLAALSVAAMFEGAARTRFAFLAGIVIAAVSPLVADWPWPHAPALLQEYIVPAGKGGRFPFFPWVSYVAFGVGLGALVRRAAAERTERFMQWGVLTGFGLILVGQYFSYLPYSIYTHSEFWSNSPALIVIRMGIMLLCMAGAYVWTEFAAGPGWSWMAVLGKNSLMVYWVHVMLVYGGVARPLKRALSIPMTAMATVLVTLAMIVLSVAWLAWKDRRASAARIVQPAEPAQAGASAGQATRR